MAEETLPVLIIETPKGFAVRWVTIEFGFWSTRLEAEDFIIRWSIAMMQSVKKNKVC